LFPRLLYIYPDLNVLSGCQGKHFICPFYYKNKTSFFFFEDIEFKPYIGGEDEGYRSILKYKLPGGIIKYYSYKYYIDYDWNESISDPIEMSQEEYDDLFSKYRKSKAYNEWWDWE
jgi:hypothetical protein